MNNIFLYEDLVFEISKHMLSTNFINFSRVNKLCYDTINSLLNNVDEHKILEQNDMTILNKSFSCYLNIEINLKKLTNIEFFRPKYKKYKLYCVKYIVSDILIRIYLNSQITITQCKSHLNARTKIHNLLLLLRNLGVIYYIPKIILKPIKTTLRFEMMNYKNLFKIHFYRGACRAEFKCVNFNKWPNNKIDATYHNFKNFYVGYNLLKSF